MRYFKNCVGNFYRLDGNLLTCWVGKGVWGIEYGTLTESGDINRYYKSHNPLLEIPEKEFNKMLYMYELTM